MPSEPAAAETPDLPALVAQLLPRMRVLQAAGWVLLAASLAVAALSLPPLLRGAQGAGDWDANILGIGVGLGLVGLTMVPRWVRRRHEAMLLPGLARGLGLDYRHSDNGFAQGLPGRLLPRNTVKTAEDAMAGELAGRRIRFAEVVAETGGRNSRKLFDGIVLEYRNAAPLPAFFVAPQGETEGWLGFAGRIAVDDLVRLDSIGRHGQAFGVWSTSAGAVTHPGFRAVLDVVTDIAGALGPEVTLYSAMSDGERIWIALRQRRDLFRVGGLLATRDVLLDDLRRAADDLTQPLRLVSALIGAEAKAAAAAAAPAQRA